MDPITILGAIASIIEIANFLEARGEVATADGIQRVFNSRATDSKTLESKLAISSSQLKTEIYSVLALRKTDKDFLKRIDTKCLPPYKDAIRDPGKSNADVEEAYAVAKRCVCENIQFARRDAGGRFPSEEFKELWEQFNCGL